MCGLAKITSCGKSKWHIGADQSMPITATYRLINAEYWTKQVHRDRLVTDQLGMIAQTSGSSLNASENGSSWSTSY
jgi:hypothetical protein